MPHPIQTMTAQKVNMSPPSSCDEPPPVATKNWQFTWEAQSHSAILRLILFNSNVRPSTQCRDLKLNLLPEKSLLTVSYLETNAQVKTLVHVPIPRVLVDSDSPLQVQVFDDHIEIKLVLLLPVDHPIISEFNSILNFEEKKDPHHPLSVDFDLKKLSCMKEVHFDCRNCSFRLTKGLGCFEEMPSVNWRDVADNWFGNCCCSFGGVSEKLVAKYVKSYTCAPGLCLLNTTSVLLCKDDLLGCKFPDATIKQNHEPDLHLPKDNCSNRTSLDETLGQVGCCGSHHERVLGVVDRGANSPQNEDNIVMNVNGRALSNANDDSSLSGIFSALNFEDNKELMNGKSNAACSQGEHCTPDTLETSSTTQTSKASAGFLENQKVFLDGYLGNGFMVRSSGLSNDIRWVQFLCPDCSCLIGAYPCYDDNIPLDGGVRLFKCNISTCLPSNPSDDAFRNYTLERMFGSQLLESAEDELSYRTIVRDIQTKSIMLQIILLNPNSWGCSGTELADKIVMYPNIKVLYSASKFDSRTLEEWMRKNQADEIYMFSSQIQEIIRILDVVNALYPPSCTSLQGLLLSTLRR